ncbi:hypothetical protein, partial [Streptomyces sp. CNQ085]|uniref:hypothetical protein n=1 Tax=Streptomyces sp. CNQ085 TaxID=2886944 RepID=UPI001F509793
MTADDGQRWPRYAAATSLERELGDPRDARNPLGFAAAAGGVPQLGIVGQQDGLGRAGPQQGLRQLPAGGRLPGARGDGG